MKTFDIVYRVAERVNGFRTRRAIVLADDEVSAKLRLIEWNAPANADITITDCEEIPGGHVIHVQY